MNSEDWRLPAALAGLLLAAVYLPGIRAPLVWDDLSVIVQNPALERPVRWADYVSPAYFGFSTEATWRPLPTALTRGTARWAGRSPAAHRGVWLTFHAAAGALLAALALALGFPAAVAAWTAALFLLHPAQVETLRCVSFNEDVLAGASTLAFLLAHRRGRIALAAAAYAAALLSKESAALALPLALLMDLCTIRRLSRPASYAAYSATLAAYAALRFGFLASPGAAAPAIPWNERAVLAAMAWLESWRILLWPRGLRLEYFALPPASRGAAAAWLLGAAASVALLALLARRAWRERPALAFALAWPSLLLAATSPLWPVGVLTLRLTAERFLYLPSMGAAIAAAWWLRGRRVLLAAVALAFAAAGARRCRDWSRESRLWSGLVREYPWSSKAHEGLGEAWLREDRFAEAAAEFAEALRLRAERRDLLLAHYASLTSELPWESPGLERKLGLALLNLGDDAAAERHLRRAIALRPAAEGNSYEALAYLTARQGRWTEARKLAENGLRYNPEDPLLHRIAADAASRRLTFRARFR